MTIELRNVQKQFGKVTALNNINLKVENGEFFTILGPSGCGKSTLLNVIAGVVPVTSGEIFFDGVCINSVSIRDRQIGYVFQNYSLYPTMTVYENIRFPLTNQKFPNLNRHERKKFMDEKIREFADLVKVGDCLDRYPDELSGGQQQRVAIARALAQNPKILLMDEPFANLDRKLAVVLRDDIFNLQKQLNITVLLVTHNQEDAYLLSDKVAVMNSGDIVQVGDVEYVFYDPTNLFVANFINTQNMTVINGREDECGFFVGERDTVRIKLPLYAQNKGCCTIAIPSEAMTVSESDDFELIGNVKRCYRKMNFYNTLVEKNGVTFYVCTSQKFLNTECVKVKINSNNIICFDQMQNKLKEWCE